MTTEDFDLIRSIIAATVRRDVDVAANQGNAVEVQNAWQTYEEEMAQLRSQCSEFG